MKKDYTSKEQSLYIFNEKHQPEHVVASSPDPTSAEISHPFMSNYVPRIPIVGPAVIVKKPMLLINLKHVNEYI